MAKKKVIKKVPVKKKRPVKKPKSKTQKKIEGKIKYQRFKLNKIRKELNDLTLNLRSKKDLSNEFTDDRLKLEALRNIDDTIKKGGLYKFKTIYSGVLNEGTKINTKLTELNKSLLKFKKPKPTEKDYYLGPNRPNDVYRTVIRSSNPSSKTIEAHVWDTKDIEDWTLNNPELSKINGISISRDKDKVLDYLNDLKTQMDSNHTLMLVYGNDNNGKLFIIDAKELEMLENKQQKKLKTKPNEKRKTGPKKRTIKTTKKRNTQPNSSRVNTGRKKGKSK